MTNPRFFAVSRHKIAQHFRHVPRGYRLFLHSRGCQRRHRLLQSRGEGNFLAGHGEQNRGDLGEQLDGGAANRGNLGETENRLGELLGAKQKGGNEGEGGMGGRERRKDRQKRRGKADNRGFLGGLGNKKWKKEEERERLCGRWKGGRKDRE